uniref:Uncharacterized protein n=1 Tax=Nelumbo nucifera TaxID=4432 RepID=A0A822YXC8_NELNU|nr:TPA_asm: hypothetical protein HUJ06_013046 [Nelumbo nucifera]
MGTIARNNDFCPLGFKQWTSFPTPRKEDIWNLGKFKIDNKGRKWVLSLIGKKWKDYKSDLKAMYYDLVTPDEAMRNYPNKVPIDQWQILVAFWNSDEGNVLSLNYID